MPTPDTTAPAVTLALVRDLMFVGKITATAAAARATVKVVRDPAKLRDAPEAAAARRLIVDLNLPGSVAAAAEWRSTTGGEVVGFVSHVDAATVAEARAAGLDRVMARSQFVNVLEGLFGAENSAKA